DNGSTSFPKAPKVAEAVSQLLTQGAFNINRGSYEGAYEVANQVLETREKLARLFHAENSKQVVFTQGITHSLNYFLLKPGDHVITTGMEHNAVMRPLYQLEKQGITYDVLPANANGEIQAKDLEALIRDNTKAVVMLHASNVCGTILPIEAIGEICAKHSIFFGVDTAQSAGTIDVDMQKCQIDFLAFTAHKGLLGPQGIGGFLISNRLNEVMVPLIAGGTGSQSDSFDMPDILPDKYESGTLNLPGIIGLHVALDYLEEMQIANIHQKKMELTGYFLEQLQQFNTVKVIGQQGVENRVAVVSLDFLGQDNGEVAFELEQDYKIMTRVGLHCAPMAHKSLGTYPHGTVRFAFSTFNTKEEIDICIHALRMLVRS
ncbi:MAG: aminotransferase class V-fold PLP-dependent enzyme, partial [Lachnospiraceae bacterium]